MLIFRIIMYLCIKVHGLVAAHKKKYYEGTDFIYKKLRLRSYTYLSLNVL